MIFLSNPSVYTLPGTWEKQPLVDAGLVIGIVLLGLTIGGIYMTFGKGGKDLKDEIVEHSKMHELGIAHKHD